jgi:protein-S-isoprenylcysteine O-methyltransferase Ste14
MRSNNTATGLTETTLNLSRGKILTRLIMILVLPAVVLFGASGQLNWVMAWIYVGLVFVFGVVSRIVLLKKDPELFKERIEALDKEDVKSWDKVLVPIVAVWGPMVILLVAGLDKRFGWPPQLSMWLQLAALLVTILAYAFGQWALNTNRFFSALVRIQKDRGHTVITTGPYHYVRHPGYTASLVAGFGVPLLLGSVWGLVPAAVVVLFFIVRTALEDKTLQSELDGYAAYAQQVRYRLVPGIW